MHKYGFFRRADAAQESASIADRIGALEDRDDVAAYLASASVLVFSLQLETSLAEDCDALLEAHLMTDGDWVWPKELSHYVRHHGFALPTAFWRHISELNFSPPPLSETELTSLAKEAQVLFN